MSRKTTVKVSLFLFSVFVSTSACLDPLHSATSSDEQVLEIAGIESNLKLKSQINTAPTPISPRGTIHQTTPTFSWEPVTSATWYRISIRDSRTLSGTPLLEMWISSGQAACSGGIATCTWTSSVSLADGEAIWWIRAFNSNGFGPWSSQIAFVVDTNARAPLAPTQIAPSSVVHTDQPTFEWEPVENALWYRIYAIGSDMHSVTIINSWVNPERAGCVDLANTCQWTSNAKFPNTSARWWVVAWNARGYSPWRGPLAFSGDLENSKLPAPRQISPIDEVSSSRPTFQWEPVERARGYRIWVVDSTSTQIDPLIRRLYITNEDAGCAGGQGTCSFAPEEELADGPASWSILAWQEISGEGYGSDFAPFWVNYRPGPPDSPTPIEPNSEINDKRPIFV